MPTLDRDGVALFYEVAGSSGPPVLLIQGCGVAGEGWRPQIDALARDHRVAVFDNRGIGKSGLPSTTGKPVTLNVADMASDARALMDHLAWDSAHVGGHSLGGVIAQQLALDTPARVRSLSLLCTFFRGRDGARLTPWILWLSIKMRVGSRASRRRAFLEMVMPGSVLDAMPAAAIDAMAADIGRLFGRDLADQPTIVMQQVKALGAHDTSAQLDRLSDLPTLVVSAAEDRVAPPAQGRALSSAIRGSRYVEVENAAHGVVIQKADAINALLVEHIAAAERARTTHAA